MRRMHRSFRKEFNIATIGWNHEKHSEEERQALSDFCRTLQKVQNRLSEKGIKIELLVCAGLTVFKDTKYSFEETFKKLSLSNIGTILFEIWDENSEGERNSHYFLFHFKSLQTQSFPEQLFANTYGSKSEWPINQVSSSNLQNLLLEGYRSFSIGNKKFTLIVCGENNIIKGNKIGNMTPLIIKFSRSLRDAEKTADLFSSSIVLNPAHTPYGINGRKRLEMMKNITKDIIKWKCGFHEINFTIPTYLHANNYSPNYKVYECTNQKIGSKYPNGSFLFKSGKYQKVAFSAWGNAENYTFILNIWSV